MAALTSNQFGQYFEAVHDCAPFPWQERLAFQVTSSGVWPNLLDLPTGTGKTAALDVALFHLALQAGRPARTAPLRILYVVDRRTIVDQAFERASRILERLKQAETGILREVCAALCELAGETPLELALLRGGIPRSDSWVRSPAQPLIAVSTVDQVGSRLLFRGYGVSRSMRPIHAGLLGNDALYLLDEVHLSQPFCQTLSGVEGRYRSWGEQVPRTPFQVVQMSATSEGNSGSFFRLDDSDLRNSKLSQRLSASKPAVLREVTGPKLVVTCELEALKMVKSASSKILVVMNRVQTARDVASRLLTQKDDFQIALLTGRMRPIDRDSIEGRLRPLIEAGRNRSISNERLIVVSTQCIEAGADFDFDGLVTECASLDSLRQRFGRLNRLGEAQSSTSAVIVASSDSLKKDPIYGSALGNTWNWLKQQQNIDFAWTKFPRDSDSTLMSPKLDAPVLLPSHLDAWVQTSPTPDPDPDIALWLHGPRSCPADCLVVWRADLNEELLLDGTQDKLVCEIVDSVPPSPGEAMPVPFVAVKRWLSGMSEARIVDIEGASGGDEDESGSGRHSRPYFLWRGDDSIIVRPPSQDLRPGDTVVVPANYGGISQGSWDPSNDDPVQDLGDLAAFRLRGRPILRLNADVLKSLLGRDINTPQLPLEDDEDAEDREVVVEWLDLQDEWGSPFDELLAELKRQRKTLRVERIGNDYAVVSGRRVRRRQFAWAIDDGDSTEDDQASFNGTGITLSQHMQGVARRAADSAAKLGCAPQTTRLLEQAALVHDLGKADRRFQIKLCGGNRYLADSAGEPLAKSTIVMLSKARRDQAAKRSGYPRGCRHECQSLAMLLASPPLEVHDVDLLLHLVASHHGYCRPFAPFVDESNDCGPVVYRQFSGPTNHDLARLDSGVAERFWRMVERYGYWGLAWLEAILRLADHRQSESEQGGKP